jgi:hypothetical protein
MLAGSPMLARPVAPFLPLVALLVALGSAAALGPGEPPAPLLAEPTLTVQPPPEEQPRRRFATPTILSTQAAWERTALELSAASAQRRTTWYVVGYTRGAGVQLHRTPAHADLLRRVDEGQLLVEIGVYTDPTWKHVWVAPDGPGGWIQSEFVAEMP